MLQAKKKKILECVLQNGQMYLFKLLYIIFRLLLLLGLNHTKMKRFGLKYKKFSHNTSCTFLLLK